MAKSLKKKSKEGSKKRWTPNDVTDLIHACQVAETTREKIAETLGRSVKSIERKADKLQLLLPSKYQRHSRVLPEQSDAAKNPAGQPKELQTSSAD